jgi:hypothetical protein
VLGDLPKAVERCLLGRRYHAANCQWILLLHLGRYQ